MISINRSLISKDINWTKNLMSTDINWTMEKRQMSFVFKKETFN